VVFKKFILGSLLVAGLTACPIVEEVVPPQPVSPVAKDDVATTSATTPATIKPADNDVKGDAELVPSSIDLDVSKGGQQISFIVLDKGTFQLNKTTGIVTFTPAAGKTGDAIARYNITDTNGNVSSNANIKVTISGTPPTGPIKVLFIGNSRTFYEPCTSGFASYNIPNMVQSMAAGESRKIEVKTVTECGQTLGGHFTNTVPPTDARVQISTKGWEYVVLQAATNETDNGTQANTRELLRNYKTAILATNPTAKIVLYENWSLLNAAADQPRLTTFYQAAADDLGSKLAPVGRAWRQGSLTELQLFNSDGDGKHATTLGAYVAASTFYSLFYGKQAPSTTGVPSGIGITEASNARTSAFNAYSSMNIKYK
jgi:Surface adhesin CshA repetitive domain